MTEAPTPALASLVIVEEILNKAEAISPQVPLPRGSELVTEDKFHLQEDYIPFPDSFADPKPNKSSHRPLDGDMRLRKAKSAEKKRRRRKRNEAETLLIRQAKIKQELISVRRTAQHTHALSFSTFSLFGSDNNLMEEFKIPLHALDVVYPGEQDVINRETLYFASQIIIRSQLNAMEYALDEYNGRRNIPGRMALWVDGSTSPQGASGTAVVFKANPRAAGSDWTVRAYTVLEFDRLGTIHTEALAIMHALRIALAKVIHDDATDAKASAVANFSDSVFTLNRIQDFGQKGQCWGSLVLGRIIRLANELKNLDVKVYLHWTPAHKNIPGNMLVDIMAKRAAKKRIFL
ncbi:hypothetical protein MMC28_003857 [Mycoblastus sanguinarius]|nr:hypothetical protein [Mycoblastus sanguinarius]